MIITDAYVASWLEVEMKVGAVIGSHNHRDWDRLLAGDYGSMPARADSDIVEETFALCELVEPLGFDSMWSAEHYGSAYSMQSNPLQWIAYWAGRTERIDFGTSVIVAPWWQPMKLIHELAMLDIMLKGRTLHMGIGRGVARHEYDAFGIDPEESRGRFTEMIEILRLADTQECFSYEGKYYKLTDVQVRPQALRKGSPTRTMKAAFNTSKSMEMAAELGLGQLFVASETMEQMQTQIAKFNGILGTRGLDPVQPTTMLYMHCTTDPDELARAKKDARRHGWAARNHYAVWKNHQGSFAGTKGYEEYAQKFQQDVTVGEDDGAAILSNAELIGTPDEILEKIQNVQSAVSLDYLLVNLKYGEKSFAEAEASMRLFAKEVLPAVQAMDTPLHEHNRGDASLVGVDTGIGSAIG